MKLGFRLEVGVLCAALCGCGTESFEHNEVDGQTIPTNASISSDSFFEASTGIAGSGSGGNQFDGNFPEPAVTRCGELPDGVQPITGLAAGWGVVALPNASADGRPVPSGSVRLRISQFEMNQCSDTLTVWFGAPGGSGGDLTPYNEGPRGVEFTLAPDELTVGIHQIGALADPDFAAVGSSSERVEAVDGTVEFLRVEDDCIVGVLRGLEGTLETPFLEGGFVVQTCQQQCIPTGGFRC